MAHLNKTQKAKMIAIRSSMVTYLEELQASLNPVEIIEFCNGGSLKSDVEWCLGRDLSASEASTLLWTPEDTCEAYGAKFGRAHATALNMKHTRQLCRTLLRESQLRGIGSALETLVSRLKMEGYAI